MRTLFLETMLLLTLSGLGSASPWHPTGPRAMGMGGAQVAIAQGPSAAYWNPAGLGQLHNPSGFELDFGVGAAFNGSVLEGANDMNRLNGDCSAGAANCTNAAINDALRKLGQPGNGALIGTGSLLAFNMKGAVVFAYNSLDVGALPIVDQANNTQATIANNQSQLVLRGANFTEIGLGYGREILETGLVLGANVKAVVGKTGYYSARVVSEDPDSDILGRFDNNSKTSVRPGIDVGLLWDMRETMSFLPMRPRIGVVARNINNPSFEQPAAAVAAGDRARLELDGQVRAGVALSPFKFWNLAADVDVTQNRTYVPGFLSRMLSVGTEINLVNSGWFNLPLRAGIQKNVAADAAVAYTGGFGLHFAHILLDVGGSVSSKSTRIQSQGEDRKIPNNFSVAARLAVLFGGVDEGGRGK